MKHRAPIWLDRILVPATGRAALSWQVMLSVALVSALLHLVGSMDLGTNDFAFRVLLAMAAVLPTFAIVALAQLAPIRGTVSRVLWILLSYAFGGAMRGAVLALELDSTGLEVGGGWQFRLPASIIIITLTTAIMTFGWATYTWHRQSALQLLNETQRLHAALSQIESESETVALEQMAEITTTLVRDLEAIAVHAVDEQVSAIQSIINNKVRPMSRALASEIDRWAPMPAPAAPLRTREIWAAANPADNLPPLLIAQTMNLAVVPSAIYVFGWGKALEHALVTIVVLALSSSLSFPLLRRYLPHVRSPWREVILTVAFVLTTVPVGLASYLVLLDTKAPATYIAIGLITYPLYAWLVVLGRTFWNETKQQEQQLLQVGADLRWAIARVNLLVWFNRGVVARLLHGPIQNSMHAAVLRLQGQGDEAVVDGVINELRSRIASVDPVFRAETATAASLQEAFAQVHELWDGIADVTIDVEPGVLAALEHDAPGSAIVLDMCREAVSNAVRHGAATRVSIELKGYERTLRIRVHDNGRMPDAGSGSGIGSRFLDNCSIEWHSSRKGDRNHLGVLIPIAQPLPN